MSEYINYNCPEGHNYKLKYNSKVKTCPRCKTLKPYYEIKNLLEGEGFIVINKANDFQGSAKSKMEFICKLGHRNISKCSHIRGGTRCKTCNDLKMREERKTPKSKIVNIVKENGYEFLGFIGEYKNRNSRVEYKCNNNHIKNVPISSILYGNKCQDCDREFKRGSNSPSWKGGRRTLYHQLRIITNKWRLDSLENNNYTCFISGDNSGGNLVVHHHYNFHKIMDETLLELKLDIRDNIGDYSDEELKMIEDLCLSKHYEYGLGVVMTDEVHKLFHNIYGNINNNMSQVLEFKIKYNEIKGT